MVAQERIIGLWNVVCSELLLAMKEEEDLQVVCTFYVTLGDCIKLLGKQSTDAEKLSGIVQDLVGQLEQYLIRSLERQSKSYYLLSFETHFLDQYFLY